MEKITTNYKNEEGTNKRVRRGWKKMKYMQE